MKIKRYSILHVRYDSGVSKWYKIKRGRSIYMLMNYFRGVNGFKWARLHYYERGKVAEKYGYFTPFTDEFNL